MADEHSVHRPVMLDELLEVLDLKQSNTVIDATLGTGGHAAEVLQQLGPDGQLIGFERDPEILESVPESVTEDSRVKIIQASYHRLGDYLDQSGLQQVDRIYFDVGVHSLHFDQTRRGFSFQRPEDPLDMRFDPATQTRTAAQIINDSTDDQLRSILKENGELRYLGPVMGALIELRPVSTVGDVTEAFDRAIPHPHRRREEMARFFQAIRIAVNDELNILKKGLRAGFDSLARGGRLAAITFHSLEDRIVKHRFRDWQQDCVCPPELPVCACDARQLCNVLDQSPVEPGKEEKEANPRSRSAHLRAVERIVGHDEQGPQ